MHSALTHAATAKARSPLQVLAGNAIPRVAMVLTPLNRMESAAREPFVPVHPLRGLLQTLCGFIGVLVKAEVVLQQLMKINGGVVIYCAHLHQHLHHSVTVQQQNKRQLIPFEVLSHNFAALIMC